MTSPTDSFGRALSSFDTNGDFGCELLEAGGFPTTAEGLGGVGLEDFAAPLAGAFGGAAPSFEATGVFCGELRVAGGLARATGGPFGTAFAGFASPSSGGFGGATALFRTTGVLGGDPGDAGDFTEVSWRTDGALDDFVGPPTGGSEGVASFLDTEGVLGGVLVAAGSFPAAARPDAGGFGKEAFPGGGPLPWTAILAPDAGGGPLPTRTTAFDAGGLGGGGTFFSILNITSDIMAGTRCVFEAISSSLHTVGQSDASVTWALSRSLPVHCLHPIKSRFMV